MINFNHLRIFCLVAEHLNMSTAAQVACVTDSAVSHTIRALEDRLGTRLFNRNGPRQLVLTEIGKKLFDELNPAFVQIEKANQKARDLVQKKRRTIVIASNQGTFEHLIAPIMPEITSQFAEFIFRFETTNPNEVAQTVRNGIADIGIVGEPFEETNDMVARSILQLQEIFVGNRHLHGKSCWTLAKLAEEPIISIPKDSRTFEYFYEHFNKQGLLFAPVIEVRQTNLVAQLISAGMGIGIIYDFMMPSFLKTYPDLIELEIDKPFPRRDLKIITTSDNNTKFDKLIDLVHEKILRNKELSSSKG